MKKGMNPEQKLCLELHKKAKREAFKLYYLPYRCYYDYLRNRAHNPSNKLMLNPCWPHPGYPVDKIIKVSQEEFEIQKDGNRSYEEMYCLDNLKPEVKEQVLKVKERFCPYGKIFDEDWERYFLKFLKGYHFENFTCFDFFGATLGELDPELGVTDESQIILCQRMYECLQDKYNSNPSKYEYEDPEDHEEYLFLYQNMPFTIIKSNDEINEAITRAKALNKPMSEAEQEAYKKRYAKND